MLFFIWLFTFVAASWTTKLRDKNVRHVFYACNLVTLLVGVDSYIGTLQGDRTGADSIRGMVLGDLSLPILIVVSVVTIVLNVFVIGKYRKRSAGKGEV